MAPVVQEAIHAILNKISSTAISDEKSLRHHLTQLVNILKEDSGYMLYMSTYHKHVRVVDKLLMAVGASTCDIVQAALQILVHFLHQENISRSLDVGHVIGRLCDVLATATDKNICIRTLWCIEKQEFPSSKFENFDKFPQLFAVMKRLATRENLTFVSATLDFELVNVLKKFLGQCTTEMISRCADWLDILLLLLISQSKPVHDVAFEIFTTHRDALNTQRPLAEYFHSSLEITLVPGLSKLVQDKGNELYGVLLWTTVLDVLGKNAHQRSVINKMLMVVESAFKNSDPAVKVAAFVAWRNLMDNFAINDHVLFNIKHLRLLMQPFMVNNARTEAVAITKFNVWWYLVTILKADIQQHFDLVLSPLLHYAAGLAPAAAATVASGAPISPGASALNSSLNNSLGTSGATVPSFHAVQILGAEALTMCLEWGGEHKADEQFTFTIPLLSPGVKVITSPQKFVAQSKTYLNITCSLVQSLGNKLPAPLLSRLWTSLILRLETMTTTLGFQATSPAGAMFMNVVQQIVTSSQLDNERVVKMFRAVCRMPDKFLSSSQFDISDRKHGSPTLTLVELLLAAPLLRSLDPGLRLSLFADLVKLGVHQETTCLLYAQSAVTALRQAARNVADGELTYALWSALVRHLHHVITKTNEVNQGDALEHSFEGMYSLLEFPATCILPYPLTKALTTSLVKLWFEFYTTFARLAALVANAPPNICADQLASRLLPKPEKDAVVLVESLASFAEHMVNCIDYSLFTNQRTLLGFTSPSKWPVNSTSKQNRPLGNLHHLAELLGTLIQRHVDLNIGSTITKHQSVAGFTLLRATLKLVQSVTSSAVIGAAFIHLAPSLGALFRGAEKTGDRKASFSTDFICRVQVFWAEFAKCVQTKFTGARDSEFIAQVSPVFMATLLHSRKPIKATSVALWSALVGTAEHLDYPSELRTVLNKAKEQRMNLHVPGLTAVVDLDTQTSDTQASQAPLPDMAGLPSPNKRTHGSFLNRAAPALSSPSPVATPERGVAKSKSPSPSPLSTASATKRPSAATPSARRRSAKEDDCVVIEPAPRRKLILTEHQKDVMRQKSVIPALYNNLDASMDSCTNIDYFQSQSSQGESSEDTASVSPAIIAGDVPSRDQSESEDAAKQLGQETNAAKGVKSDEPVLVRILSQIENDPVLIESPDTQATKDGIRTPTVTKREEKSPVVASALSRELSKSKGWRGKRGTRLTTSDQKRSRGGDAMKRATPIKVSDVVAAPTMTDIRVETSTPLKLNNGKEVISTQVGFGIGNGNDLKTLLNPGHGSAKKNSTNRHYRRTLSPRSLDLSGAGDAITPRNNVVQSPDEQASTEIDVVAETVPSDAFPATTSSFSPSVLVEDTQSPMKFSQLLGRVGDASDSQETTDDANDSVAETPEKVESSPIKRNLDSVNFKLDNVLLESQLEPRICLHKLMSSEIQKLSPSKENDGGNIAAPNATHRNRRSLLGAAHSAQSGAALDDGDAESHDIVPCSQVDGDQIAVAAMEETPEDVEATDAVKEESVEKTDESVKNAATIDEVNNSDEKPRRSRKRERKSLSSIDHGKAKSSSKTVSQRDGSDDSFDFNSDTVRLAALSDRASREMKRLSIDMVCISQPRMRSSPSAASRRRRSAYARAASPKRPKPTLVQRSSGDDNVVNRRRRSDGDNRHMRKKKRNPATEAEMETTSIEPSATAVSVSDDVSDVQNQVDVENPVDAQVNEDEDIFHDALPELPGDVIADVASQEVAMETVETSPVEINNSTDVNSPVKPALIAQSPETPKSCGNDVIVRRRFTSAPKSPVSNKSPLQSRGLRLLALAKQQTGHVIDKEKISPKHGEGLKPTAAMTEPVKRRGLSRVDIILSRSRKALNKSLVIADVISGGSSADDEAKPATATTESPALSPIMSPGSGILKKRKFERLGVVVDSPSPPNKHRRVSFAVTDDVRLLTGATGAAGCRSPLSESKAFARRKPVKSAARAAVSRCLIGSAPDATQSDNGAQQVDETPVDTAVKSAVIEDENVNDSGDVALKNDVPSTDVGDVTSLPITAESDECGAAMSVAVTESLMSNEPASSDLESADTHEFDNEHPICARLVRSEQPLEEVLTRLTTTMWCRSLSECLQSRGLSTVGHLARMTEYAVHRLPGVKSPRVQTVQQLLASLSSAEGVSELAATDLSPIKLVESPNKCLPSAEDALDSLSHHKDENLDDTIEMEANAAATPVGPNMNSPAVCLRMETDDELDRTVDASFAEDNVVAERLTNVPDSVAPDEDQSANDAAERSVSAETENVENVAERPCDATEVVATCAVLVAAVDESQRKSPSDDVSQSTGDSDDAHVYDAVTATLDVGSATLQNSQDGNNNRTKEDATESHTDATVSPGTSASSVSLPLVDFTSLESLLDVVLATSPSNLRLASADTNRLELLVKLSQMQTHLMTSLLDDKM